MAKQSLDLLKRIADQLAITFHGAHWCRCVGEAALDQHGKHVDCKGMPELMGAKPDRDAGVRAAAARPCEERFPRVGQHRMATLGQPGDRGFGRRSIATANNNTWPFIGCHDLNITCPPPNEKK